MDGKAYAKEYGGSFEALLRFGERYRADAAVRARVAAGDFSDLGLEFPDGVEVRVVEQSAEAYYFPLPPQPDTALSDEALEAVAGGNRRDYCFDTQSTNPCQACACVT